MSKLPKMHIFALILCLIALTGCSAPPYADNKDTIRQKQTSESSSRIGQNYQQRGIMSSEDYLRWEQVGNKVGLRKRIDDDDLDWAISMMKKTSTQPAEVHMDIMSLFLTAKAFTPEQQEKIRNAVNPLLLSSDRDEPKWARAVIKKLSR